MNELARHTVPNTEGPTLEDVRLALARAKEQERLDKMNSS